MALTGGRSGGMRRDGLYVRVHRSVVSARSRRRCLLSSPSEKVKTALLFSELTPLLSVSHSHTFSLINQHGCDSNHRRCAVWSSSVQHSRRTLKTIQTDVCGCSELHACDLRIKCQMGALVESDCAKRLSSKYCMYNCQRHRPIPLLLHQHLWTTYSAVGHVVECTLV